MIFEHQVSITSLSGAGSSSLLAELKKLLPDERYRWISGGDEMRKIAAELGMTIEKFVEHNRLHPEDGYDRLLDERIRNMAEEDWMVSEGRLPQHFMPRAFHVSLECSLNVRARRRRDQKHPDLEVGEVARMLQKRDDDDRIRYISLYGPECLWAAEQYDLRLSSEHSPPAQLALWLLEEHQKWLTKVEVKAR